MNKILLILSTTLLIIFAFTACGSKQEIVKEPIKQPAILQGGEEEKAESLAKDYLLQKNPEISLNERADRIMYDGYSYNVEIKDKKGNGYFCIVDTSLREEILCTNN